jgi:hypothetical protein
MDGLTSDEGSVQGVREMEQEQERRKRGTDRHTTLNVIRIDRWMTGPLTASWFYVNNT